MLDHPAGRRAEPVVGWRAPVTLVIEHRISMTPLSGKPPAENITVERS